MKPQRKRIAVACQGGGSHTAFTAGVLDRILQDEHHLVALSGTSGGAICALMAWYGLLHRDRRMGRALLESFWEANAAASWPDRLLNGLVTGGVRLRNWVSAPEVSPYVLPDWGQRRLRALLGEHVDFAGIPALLGPDSPSLFVGAVEVLSGTFRVFRDHEITADAILASAAIPTLFRAVPVGAGLYWDGLFSHNPPVRDLPDAKPDQIWVVQINPRASTAEPRTVEEILDRRNELSGNLSLEQELHFIEKINEFVRQGAFSHDRYKIIEIRRIEMAWDLDYASKLDRDPAFLRALMDHGRERAEEFLVSA
ncbi:patatin-like phospholipase family protein [Arenibaculum pallidiluteum]|uniref:patatin-like phospholipase family protein n=1 Tax=Arenibaculum pallidiluteum TaxID=2812559 RepID=UPI001A972D3C|nr:patatin-like phospholipase family protein [Arenibaculum pallidiluteum]